MSKPKQRANSTAFGSQTEKEATVAGRHNREEEKEK